MTLHHRVEPLQIRGASCIWICEGAGTGNIAYWAYDPGGFIEATLPPEAPGSPSFTHYRTRVGPWLFYNRIGNATDGPRYHRPDLDGLVDLAAFTATGPVNTPSIQFPNDSLPSPDSASQGGFARFDFIGAAIPDEAINVVTRIVFEQAAGDFTYTAAEAGWQAWDNTVQFAHGQSSTTTVVVDPASTATRKIWKINDHADADFSEHGALPDSFYRGGAFAIPNAVLRGGGTSTNGSAGFRAQLLSVTAYREYDLPDDAPVPGLCVHPREVKCHPMVTADMSETYKGATPVPFSTEVIGPAAPIHPALYDFNITDGEEFAGGGYFAPGFVPLRLRYRILGNYMGGAASAGKIVVQRGFKAAHVNYFTGTVLDDDPLLAGFTLEWTAANSPWPSATLTDDGGGRFSIFSALPEEIMIEEELTCIDRNGLRYGVGLFGVLTTSAGTHLNGQLVVTAVGEQYPTKAFNHVVHSETRSREPAVVDSVRGSSLSFTRVPMPINESTDTQSIESWMIVEGYNVNGDPNGSTRWLEVLAAPSQEGSPFGSTVSRTGGVVRLTMQEPRLGDSQPGGELGAFNANVSDSAASDAIGLLCREVDIFGTPTGASFDRVTFYARRVGTVGSNTSSFDPYPPEVFGIDWGDSGGQVEALGTEVLTFAGAALPTPTAGQLLPDFDALEISRQPSKQHVYQQPGTYQVFGLVRERGENQQPAAPIYKTVTFTLTTAPLSGFTESATLTITYEAATTSTNDPAPFAGSGGLHGIHIAPGSVVKVRLSNVTGTVGNAIPYVAAEANGNVDYSVQFDDGTHTAALVTSAPYPDSGEGQVSFFYRNPVFQVVSFSFYVRVGASAASPSVPEAAQASLVGPVQVVVRPCLEIGDAPPFFDINNLQLRPRAAELAFE